MPITGRVRNQAMKATLAAMPDLVRSAFGDAIRVTASEMVRSAKSRVPVRTGTLRDHIDFSFSPTYARAKVGITPGTVVVRDNVRLSFKKNQISARAQAWRDRGYRVLRASHYAHMVEFGTVRMSPRPFMGPSFRAQQPLLESRMRSAQKVTIDSLANIGSRFL